MPISNLSIYHNIATESYSNLKFRIEKEKISKEGGSNGHAINYDPDLNTFRQSMITIVFAGMWLEQNIYEEILSRTGLDIVRRYNSKEYREWLIRLEIVSAEVLDEIDAFMSAREILMNSTIVNDKSIETAQKEASRAQRIIASI
ncbi:MAG TPA: hypothetical protein PKD17_13990 [Cellvibrionaceae bacterium]|nr:hypothetical protein [Cellvibrionaceae bacterium]HNG59112.1 hypothetical protein [Cellvibrionaceae bacterium]